jgi:DNA-directed RNA polymerase subunit RPC12/RpoP
MCFACGHRLQEEAAESAEIKCPSCGTMISADAVMCYACGHKPGGETDKKTVPVKKVLKKKVV